MSEFDKIEDEAAHWVSREDSGLTSEEREELASWLASTPHRVAYLRLTTAWEKTTRLAALRGAAQLVDHPPNRFYRYWPLAAAAVLLVLVGAIALLRFYWSVPATQEIVYATEAGERPTLHLVDGTQIQLDANSRLHATISASGRSVTLEKGEAYFEVAHESDRPFVVIAGKHRISDLGTKFSVQRDGDNVRVVVTEGRVRVDNTDTLSPEFPIFADRGSVVVAKADETVLTALTEKELTDELGWRDGRLIFNQTNLADAASDFNRYNFRKLVVTGAARDIKIGGSFRADNMDVFVGLIREPFGLSVAERGDTVILSKK